MCGSVYEGAAGNHNETAAGLVGDRAFAVVLVYFY